MIALSLINYFYSVTALMDNAQQVPPGHNPKVKMLSSTWAAKASSKYEVYLLLVTEVKAYLPRKEHLTICKFSLPLLINLLDFLKDIISGRKKFIK